jgi:hypothetical protein
VIIVPRNDDRAGRSTRIQVAASFRERAKHPQTEPDAETRRITREIITEFPRFGPKQVAAMAEHRYGIALDLDMVRGALAELEGEPHA